MTSFKYKGRGVTQLTGRTAHTVWIDEMVDSNVKIRWQPHETRRNWLIAAPAEVLPRGRLWGLNEYDLDPIQKWCEEHNCGTRMSFDMFKFRSKKEITMFMLRWAS